jgi:hypothetical protein
MKTSDFFELVGKTIVKLDEDGLETSDGNKYIFYHEQDCCESVGLFKMEGDVNNILNSPVILAEEDGSEPKDFDAKYEDSYTFSNYFLETAKGRLEIYFLGSSNGYYGESMNFYKVD